MEPPQGFVKTEFVRKRSDGVEDKIEKTRRKNREGLHNSDERRRRSREEEGEGDRERESSPNDSERGHLINGDHQGRPLDTRRNTMDVEKIGVSPESGTRAG